MRFPLPGRSRTPADFRERLHSLAPDFDCDVDLLGADGPLGRPARVAERTVGNRFAIHPMEGWDATREGAPTDHTLRRWRRFGASGAKLIWGGEAFAVSEDGRANPNQLFLGSRDVASRGLAALRGELLEAHRDRGWTTDDLLLGLQLTHSGRFAHPDGPPRPRIACAHPVLDARLGAPAAEALLGDGELESIGERFVEAARLAREVGFDFVDVKCCHGYLLHELLGARARPGPYGGSFANRTRLFRCIVESIRSSCPGLAIGVRVSIADVFPHASGADGAGEPRGWEQHAPYEHQFGVDARDPRRFDLSEPLRFLALVRELGIRLVNVTLGSPYYCPHLQRPAAYPPSDGYEPPRDPLLEVLEHLRATRACKRAFPDLLVVGSGYSYLQEFLPHVAQRELAAEHADFVGIGRMALAYPELCADSLARRPLDRRRMCRTFSDCTTAPRNGLASGCYPLDPYYQALPEAERVRELRRQIRGREG